MSNLCVVLFLLLLLQAWPQIAVSRSGSAVKFLPGFEGPLPFELETGYIGVGKSEDVQLFYYFAKSQGIAEEDPLMLWLTGGPRCSSLSALVFEIGPLNFKIEEYNGTIPTLVLNPHSWTKAASIIFVDSPVDTGFSYASTPSASLSDDFLQIQQLHQFLRKWLMEHSEFISNPTYIGGDSYSGIILPPLVREVLNGNEEGITPLINFKGYVLGNPLTDHSVDGESSRIPYAHGMGLISDELHQALKDSCGGEYANIDPTNSLCLKHMDTFERLVSDINVIHTLEPVCAIFSPKPTEILGGRRRRRRRRSLHPTFQDLQFRDLDPTPLPTINCRTYGYMLSIYWANENSVRKAFNVREGSIEIWERCKTDIIPYSTQINSTVEYHAYLGKKGYPSLIYSGDHDFVVPFLGTQEWIRSLNYSIIDDWRPWYVQHQVAGYTRTYSNKMTFATIKGGGHIAPEYKPKEGFAMFEKWIHQKPL